MRALPRSSILMLPLLALVPLASGCVTLTPAAARLREAAPEGVTQCAFQGTVIGVDNKASFGGSTVERAKTDALNRAAERGATHVVWLSVSGNTAMARAYQCS